MYETMQFEAQLQVQPKEKIATETKMKLLKDTNSSYKYKKLMSPKTVCYRFKVV